MTSLNLLPCALMAGRAWPWLERTSWKASGSAPLVFRSPDSEELRHERRLRPERESRPQNVGYFSVNLQKETQPRGESCARASPQLLKCCGGALLCRRSSAIALN